MIISLARYELILFYLRAKLSPSLSCSREIFYAYSKKKYNEYISHLSWGPHTEHA